MKLRYSVSGRNQAELESAAQLAVRGFVKPGYRIDIDQIDASSLVEAAGGHEPVLWQADVEAEVVAETAPQRYHL